MSSRKAVDGDAGRTSAMRESTLLRLPCSFFESFSPLSLSAVVSFSFPNRLLNGLKNDECVELFTLIGEGRLLLVFFVASADEAESGPGSRVESWASVGTDGT